jgi:hypothetical protein
MFASSRIAKILASLKLPPVLVELAAIVDVSAVMVLDAAVVSAAPVSFLAHAPTVSAAAVRAATLNLATTILPSLPKIKNKPLRLSSGTSLLVWGSKAKSVHSHVV